MLKKYLCLLIIIIFSAISHYGQGIQETQLKKETLMVMPFQNNTFEKDGASYNWLGESFAEAISDLLSGKFQLTSNKGFIVGRRDFFGFNVLANSERKVAQLNQNIPLGNVASLATILRLAIKQNVTKVIIGDFKVHSTTVEGKEVPMVFINARIINVSMGTFEFSTDDYGRPKINNEGKLEFRIFSVDYPLSDLQSAQGDITYQILLNQKVFTTSLQIMKTAATRVPKRAFEALIKGILTKSANTREIYFKNALQEYSNAYSGQIYLDAALELAHIYLRESKLSEATQYFEQIINSQQKCDADATNQEKPLQCSNEVFVEASFYLGLAYLRQSKFEQALGVLQPLADDYKLISACNVMGVIYIQASRAEKKNPAKAAAQLQDGLSYLTKAAISTINDKNIIFNYAVGLFLSRKYSEAADQFRSAIVANVNDGEAYFLLSKSIQGLREPANPDVDAKTIKLLTNNNRYANLESEWRQFGTVDKVPLRVEQPKREQFLSVVLSSQRGEQLLKSNSDATTLIGEARKLVKNGQDEDAFNLLRIIQIRDGLSGEPYFLLGILHLRASRLDPAIDCFRSAIFYDPSIIGPYVELTKIYVEKKNCQLAKTYALSAIKVVENTNRTKISTSDFDLMVGETESLARLVERCSN